jgi:hypothetical protein
MPPAAHPATGSDETLASFVHASINYSTSTTYHLWVQVNGPTIDYSVDVGGTVYTSGTVTDNRIKVGGPGFRLVANNAYFDNFKICTLP